MNIKELIGTVAPVIASAFGTPLAGVAVKAACEALGLSDHTQEALQTALSGAKPEDLLKLKQADQQFAKDMKALDVDLERIAAGDRDSARGMQKETKSYMPAVLACLIVGLYIAVQWFLLTHVVNDDMREIVMRSLGTLDAAVGLVLAFYFGSSSSSRQKDQALADIAKTP